MKRGRKKKKKKGKNNTGKKKTGGKKKNSEKKLRKKNSGKKTQKKLSLGGIKLGTFCLKDHYFDRHCHHIFLGFFFVRKLDFFLPYQVNHFSKMCLMNNLMPNPLNSHTKLGSVST